ncbi:hypothetical protein HDF09_003388 [Edaphobacter lichenicola]|uniref:Uncharacterized protein n=1 Tax=Tunturiibacter empetritectus TaxID=3069691 RepID=A0A7W8MTX8_9BACT|nr:hypothetical protein [Edaphobacter lichenicola]
MPYLRGLVCIVALIGVAQAQKAKHLTTIPSAPIRRPLLHIFAAGPQSAKFNQQIQLLSTITDLIIQSHILIVPITYSFLTMGWPRGLSIANVDEAKEETARTRFGWKEGKQELLIVLTDTRDRVRLRNYDPVTSQHIHSSLLSHEADEIP